MDILPLLSEEYKRLLCFIGEKKKSEKPGGQVITASTCLHKDKLYWSAEDLLANLKALGVAVKLGVEVSADFLTAEAPCGRQRYDGP